MMCLNCSGFSIKILNLEKCYFSYRRQYWSSQHVSYGSVWRYYQQCSVSFTVVFSKSKVMFIGMNNIYQDWYTTMTYCVQMWWWGVMSASRWISCL